jgi:predicted methyltransferase
VTVVDSDQRVLAAIDSLAQERMLPIHTIEFDLARVIKGELPPLSKADIFITDPPYSLGGALAFVFVGAYFLKMGGSGYVVFPSSDYETWSRPYLMELQRFLIGAGFVVDEKVNRFHVYEDEKGVSSGIMRVLRLSDVAPSLPTINAGQFLPSSCRRADAPHGGIGGTGC